MIERLKMAGAARGNTKADKLSQATELALDVVLKILALDVSADDVRLLAHIKDTALAVISQQIRVDEGRLRSSSGEDRSTPEFDAAVRRFEERERERLAEKQAEAKAVEPTES
jgi:hypothetical protein